MINQGLPLPRFRTAAKSFFPLTALFLLTGLLMGCTAADRDPTDGIHDPFETQNRAVHRFNRGLDKALVRPAARGYTKVLPDPVQTGIGNVATNLGQPSVATNSLLQGDIRGTGISVARFVVNSTIGLLGLVDAASAMGLPDHTTDFGETLHVWGAGEGAYVELPVVGPSTSRDAVGIVVDLVTNPLVYLLNSPENTYGTIASAAARLGDRGRYSDTVDSILYESADSYAQSRLIYMQNRRFDLGQQEAATEIDPFELNTEGF